MPLLRRLYALANNDDLFSIERLEVLLNTLVSLSLADETKDSIEKKFPDLGRYFPERITLYRGNGCAVCNGTGYRGRIALFELIPITPELQDLALKNPTAQQIWAAARKTGTHSLFEDGIEKIKLGSTTIEELLRVSAVPPTGDVL